MGSFCFSLTGCQLHGKEQQLQEEQKNELIRAKIRLVNQKKRLKVAQNNQRVIKAPTSSKPKPFQSLVTKTDDTLLRKKLKRFKLKVDKDETPSTPSFMKFLEGPAEVKLKKESPGAAVPPPATLDTKRIALLLPLSGPNQSLGKAMLKASQLAMFSFADSNFELLIYNTDGSPSGAEKAAQKAIGDGAELILGPLLAASVKAAAVASQAANVPILAFSNNQSVAGNGVFIFGFRPEEQVERVVAHATSQGIKRFGVLAPKNTYGISIVKSLHKTANNLGSFVVSTHLYDQFVEDFSDIIKELANYKQRRGALLDQRKALEKEKGELAKKALKRLQGVQTIGKLPFEALLVADGGNRLKAIAALLPFYGIDPEEIKILGTGQWDEPEIGKEPALVGAWFAAPSPKSRMLFENEYRKVFGEPPPRLATLAYDAVALVAILANKKGKGVFDYKRLTNPSGFLGRDGIFRLMPNGTTDRGLAILEVGIDKNRVISAAPKTFKKER